MVELLSVRSDVASMDGASVDIDSSSPDPGPSKTPPGSMPGAGTAATRAKAAVT